MKNRNWPGTTPRVGRGRVRESTIRNKDTIDRFFNMLTLTETMTGRPRNPNRPPAQYGVRLTKSAYQKMEKLHIGDEPYSNTIERTFDERNELIKKSKALDLEIEELHYGIKDKNIANDELINIIRKRDGEITTLKAQRHAMQQYTQDQ